jgi:hypothetical protein
MEEVDATPSLERPPTFLLSFTSSNEQIEACDKFVVSLSRTEALQLRDCSNAFDLNTLIAAVHTFSSTGSFFTGIVELMPSDTVIDDDVSCVVES